MTQVLDPGIEKVLDQAFADNHEQTLRGSRRHEDAMDNIAEATKLAHLAEGMKVGTREAAAMQRMDTSKLAEQILQQRAAKGQPQADAA